MDAVIGSMNDFLYELRESCKEEEYIEYRRGIGGIMAEIYIRIREPIYKLHPDLDPESDTEV
jgi:hypothetical protein